MQQASPSQPQVKDNRLKAILFMNLFAIGGTGQSVMFKLAASAGAAVIDYQVFRNLGILLVSSIELSCIKRNPYTEFPWPDKHALLWRCLTGQLCFFLYNFSLNLIPLTFTSIIF